MSPLVHGMIAWLIAILILKNVNDRRLAVIAGVVPDIDGIFVLSRSLIEACRSPGRFPLQLRIGFGVRNPSKLVGGQQGLVVFFIQYGQFARDIGFQGMSGVAAPPILEDCNCIGPATQSNVGGCGIVLGGDIDG